MMAMGTPPGLSTDVSAEAIYRTLCDLCAFGNRFVGSKGERAARQFIYDQFREVGLSDVRIEEFEVLGYRPESASCELEDGFALPSVGLQFTASDSVEADAVYLGSPQSIEDLVKAEETFNVADRIAVIHSYWPFGFAEELVARGAAGIVVFADTPEGRIGNYTAQIYPTPLPPDFAGRPLPIPGVTVEVQAAHHMLASLVAGKRHMRIEHRASYGPTTTANVIAEIPGGELAEERVVLGAHYDTQLTGVGASDNGSGIASLIEIARDWSSRSLRRTAVFIAFGDEEHGFSGGVNYCRKHANTLASTVGMVNLDALGWLYPGTRLLHADPSIRSLALDSASMAGWAVEDELEASLMAASDHNPFIDAGVPACLFWRHPPQHPFFHTVGDDPELVDPEIIAGTARAAALTALRLIQEDHELGRSRPIRRWMDLRPDPA